MLSRNPITISLEQERLRNSVEKWEKCTKNSSKNCTGHRVWKKAMKKPARNRSLKKKKKGLWNGYCFFVCWKMDGYGKFCQWLQQHLRLLKSMMHFCFFQILIIAVVIVATFVIPISHLNQLHSGWIYTTLVGNCLFIILQMVCLIDSTGSICKNLDKIASRSRWWAFVEVSTYHHANRDCQNNMQMIFFTSIGNEQNSSPLSISHIIWVNRKIEKKNCISTIRESYCNLFLTIGLSGHIRLVALVDNGHRHFCHAWTSRVLPHQAPRHHFQHWVLHHPHFGRTHTMCTEAWQWRG